VAAGVGGGRCRRWGSRLPTHDMSRPADPTQPAGLSLALLLIFYISLTANSADAIRCYECNSKHDPRCGDPFSNITSMLMDCDQDKRLDQGHLPVGEDGGPLKSSICRKTYQTTNAETRIVRSCGWIENEGTMKDRTCFTRTGTYQVMVTHCVCKDDGCNASSSLVPFYTLVLTIVTAVTFIGRNILA